MMNEDNVSVKFMSAGEEDDFHITGPSLVIIVDLEKPEVKSDANEKSERTTEE